MPNHFHGLIGLSSLVDSKDLGSAERNIPIGGSSVYLQKSESLNSIVGAFKSAVTKNVNQMRGTPGAQFWQKGFHDHVVRNVAEFEELTSYIAFNPLNWHLDRINPDFESVLEDVRTWKTEHGL